MTAAVTAFVAAAPAAGGPLMFASQSAAAHVAAPLPASGAASKLKPTKAPSNAAQDSAVKGSTSSSDPILLYSQDWNSAANTRSTAAWQQVADTHSILVGTPGKVYGNMITQLHAWNPALKVLVYDLGPYTIRGSAEFNTLMANDPSYFAHDASGNLITVKAASGTGAFPNNYLMDEANPGWQAEEASRVLANIQKYGFDGAYIDSMGPGPFSGTTTAVPIDPSTGVAFTKASWMEAAGQTLSTIKAAIGTKFLFSTGLVNGLEFTSFTHYLSDSTVDGVQTDSWLRVASSSPAQYPSTKSLAADLAMVQTLNADGKSFFGWTKIWCSATPAQQAAWNTYALAAYLLVDNGTSDYYLYSAPSSGADRSTIYFPNELSTLGAPTAAFTLTSGVYSRSFANGTVTLNTNNNTASITVS